MKRCRFCAEEIQDAAVVCKHCGRDQRPTETRAARSLGKWALIAVVVLVCGVFLTLAVEMVTTGKLTNGIPGAAGCDLSADTLTGRERVQVRAAYDLVGHELLLTTDAQLSDAQATDVITRCADFLRPKLQENTMPLTHASLKHHSGTTKAY